MKTIPHFQPPFNDLTGFILQQHAQMPDYLRGPMLAATLGFGHPRLVERRKMVSSSAAGNATTPDRRLEIFKCRI